MDKTVNALLHGTLDALILRTLVQGPLHGYAIARSIEIAAGDALKSRTVRSIRALSTQQRGWLSRSGERRSWAAAPSSIG